MRVNTGVRFSSPPYCINQNTISERKITMRLYVNGRGSGKTMWAMMESARTGVPILAFSRQRKQIIRKMALDFGIEIPEPVTIEELNESGKNKAEEVIVDEAQELLQRMLEVKITGLTMTDSDKNKL